MNEFRVHRPGAASAFFVYQAGLVAAGFWAWLVLATVRGGLAARWESVAGTGAGTATMIGVVLAVRYYLQRNAAARHEQVMQALVDLSWQSFAISARESSALSERGTTLLSGHDSGPSGPESPTRDLTTDADATTGVIRLPQETPRNRR